MDITAIILYAVTAVSVVSAAVALVLWFRRKRDIEALAKSVEHYIEKGTPLDFSTKDNCFSALQNSFNDLQNLIELEKHNTAVQSEKNTEFISDVSHQLKTPLAALRLYCEMEHARKPDEHTEKELQLIEKMEGLIYRLLRLEKIRSDSYVMEFQFYETADILKTLIADFQPLFPKKNFILTGGGRMRCDRDWISEALGNLIKNAAEHTAEDGNIRITIDTSEKSTTITVSDDGGGVPEEELPKLFTRFHKTENASPNSAGIGLAITKAIVEKHHGTISAENRDKGFCVIMCFPHIDGYITI